MTSDVNTQEDELRGKSSADIEEFESDFPEKDESVGAIAGAGIGGAASLTALSALGTVPGLSAAGIASGLVAAGSILGGGMVAGIGVLAAPVALLSFAGYSIVKKRNAMAVEQKKAMLERKEIIEGASCKSTQTRSG
jgi:hypothetical protein